MTANHAVLVRGLSAQTNGSPACQPNQPSSKAPCLATGTCPSVKEPDAAGEAVLSGRQSAARLMPVVRRLTLFWRAGASLLGSFAALQH